MYQAWTELVIVPRTWEPGKLGNWETGNLGNREPEKKNSYQAINLTVKHWKEHPYKQEHFCLICGQIGALKPKCKNLFEICGLLVRFGRSLPPLSLLASPRFLSQQKKTCLMTGFISFSYKQYIKYILGTVINY